MFVLPSRDSEGRRVIFNYTNEFDPENQSKSEIMRAFMITLESLMMDEENQIRGLTYIFYCKGLTFSHVGIWTPSEAARLFGTCEKNLAVRHRDINLSR